MRPDQALSGFGQLVAEYEYFEFSWFPHAANCTTKRSNRTPGPAAALGRLRRRGAVRGTGGWKMRLSTFARPSGTPLGPVES